jgi:hypothetical protein
MPQSWDMGHIIYLPSEGRHTVDFSDARKIQRTRVPVASMLTTIPPKPSWQRNEHIQGYIETKVSKRRFVWTKTIRYPAISFDNITQIWRKLLILVLNIAAKFFYCMT